MTEGIIMEIGKFLGVLCVTVVYCQALHLAGMDAHVNRRTVRLFTLDTLNIDHVLSPVHLHHLSNLLSFVMSTHNLCADTK